MASTLLFLIRHSGHPEFDTKEYTESKQIVHRASSVCDSISTVFNNTEFVSARPDMIRLCMLVRVQSATKVSTDLDSKNMYVPTYTRLNCLNIKVVSACFWHFYRVLAFLWSYLLVLKYSAGIFISGFRRPNDQTN